MFLSRVSIQRPILALMLNLALILFGIIGLSRLPVRELPDIDPPVISVVTVYPGANAQVVETEVSERLEEAINNIEGIKSLRSESREGVSAVTIEFDLSRDIDTAAQDVRDRVSRIRGALPIDIREPIVSKQDADASPIIWIAINSDRYSPLELTTLAERQVKPRFQSVAGVSRDHRWRETLRHAALVGLSPDGGPAGDGARRPARLATTEPRTAERPRGKPGPRNDDPNARRTEVRRGIQRARHP